MALVKKFGGFWIDASVYVHSDEAIEYFYTNAVEVKAQIIGPNHEYHGDWPCHVASYFFGAPKNSLFISLWFAEFEKVVIMGLIEYKKALLNELPHFQFDGDHYIIDDVEYIVETRNAEMCRKVSRSYVRPFHRYCPYALPFECRALQFQYPEGYRCIESRLQRKTEREHFPFVKMDHRWRSGKAMHLHEGKKERQGMEKDL